MPTNETRPAIGTAEAAVQSCVRLIASVAGQPEALVAYWLDLYYQVRCVYERENAAEPDPTVLRRGDLYPVLRELMQDALKSAVSGEAKDRMDRKRAREEAKAELQAEAEAAWQGYLKANGFKDPSTPLRVAQDDRKDSGPPRASAPTGEAENGDADSESAPPSESTLSGFAPVDLTPDRGGWKRKKAAIRDRLIAARDQGVTAAQLVTASEQKISDGEIYAILNAAKADMGTYRRLEAALEALGR